MLENFYSYKIDGMTANPLKFYGFLNFGPQRFTENRLCGKLTDHMEISSGGTAVTIFNRLLAAVKYIVKKADMVLLGLCLVCTAFGIVLIASATAYRGTSYQLRRVIIQTAGAVMSMVVTLSGAMNGGVYVSVVYPVFGTTFPPISRDTNGASFRAPFL